MLLITHNSEWKRPRLPLAFISLPINECDYALYGKANSIQIESCAPIHTVLCILDQTDYLIRFFKDAFPSDVHFFCLYHHFTLHKQIYFFFYASILVRSIAPCIEEKKVKKRYSGADLLYTHIHANFSLCWILLSIHLPFSLIKWIL